jgi:NtrC-family two-component system response regulator AlgB
MPTLRERREDILPLATHYQRFFERRYGKAAQAFSPQAEQSMQGYNWPVNLRQLRNAVERAVILAPSRTLEARDLGLPADAAPRVPAVGDDVSLEQLEREHIARVVARAPSFEAAARTLGIDVTTLQRKRKRYGLA